MPADAPDTLLGVAKGQGGGVVEEAAYVHELHHQEVAPPLQTMVSSRLETGARR